MITALSVFCVYLGGVMLYGFASTIKKHHDEYEKEQRWIRYQKRNQWRLHDTLS